MQECKGICDKYKADIPPQSTGLSKFAVGIYKCQVCKCDLTVNGVKFTKRFLCRCCSSPIRMKPRNNKKNYQESLNRIMEILRDG